MASVIPLVGDAPVSPPRHADQVRTMREGTRPSRTFWWDRARPADAAVDPLRAVIFNLDGALADIERDGHRVAFNTAFAAHGLDVVWDVEDYGRLLRIGDEQRRIAVDLRRRGFGKASGKLATQIHRTKSAVLHDCLLDGDVAPRPGLIDSVMSLFVAGVWVGVVAKGRRAWAEPLVRQLVGDGIVETIVTSDDLAEPASECDGYALALWEFGIDPESALAVEGSAAGLRAAAAVGLATVVVTTDYTARQDFTGAAAVRSAYDGADPLLASSCERLHGRWWTTKKRSAAA
jgi:beta-phosphoglucomutase-like phosphatase (HAD superfamily)